MARPLIHPLRLIFRALAMVEERGLNELSERGLISDEVATTDAISPADTIRILEHLEDQPGRLNQLWIIDIRLHYLAPY